MGITTEDAESDVVKFCRPTAKVRFWTRLRGCRVEDCTYTLYWFIFDCIRCIPIGFFVNNAAVPVDVRGLLPHR